MFPFCPSAHRPRAARHSEPQLWARCPPQEPTGQTLFCPHPPQGPQPLNSPAPGWPTRVPLPRRGHRRTFSPISPHQPARNGGTCFPITPHKTPARSGLRRPGKAPPFLTPLGSWPSSPLPHPLQVPRPPRLNLVQEMQPAPCPGLPGLFPAPSAPTPASVTTSKGICSGTPSLTPGLIRLQ